MLEDNNVIREGLGEEPFWVSCTRRVWPTLEVMMFVCSARIWGWV